MAYVLYPTLFLKLFPVGSLAAKLGRAVRATRCFHVDVAAAVGALFRFRSHFRLLEKTDAGQAVDALDHQEYNKRHNHKIQQIRDKRTVIEGRHR